MNLPLNIDISQILLHILNFALLFGILYFLLYGPVRKFMNKRTEEYRKIDEQTRKKLEEAENMKSDLSARFASVNDEIAASKAKAEKDAETLASERLKKAEADAESIVNAAKNAAENEKKRIVESAQGEIAGMVADAAKKAIFESASGSYDSFLDSAEDPGADKN